MSTMRVVNHHADTTITVASSDMPVHWKASGDAFVVKGEIGNSWLLVADGLEAEAARIRAWVEKSARRDAADELTRMRAEEGA